MEFPVINRTPQEMVASVNKLEAETAKALAERDKALEEAQQIRIDTQSQEIVLRKHIRAEAAELATDKYFHIYVFDTPVGSQSVKACITQLSEWSRTSDEVEIEIVFNSPGGSVVDGMALYDFIIGLRNKGHKITTSTLGMAASMAGILLQAGEVRTMGAQSWLLIHEASFGAGGSYGDVMDTVEWVKKVQDRILDIFAARSKMSKAAIKRKWHRTDWWIDSDEALKLGFIDIIG